MGSPVSRVDFSSTASDYTKYRAGFPEKLFRRLEGHGIGEPGQRVVDLGTGTGSLARGVARRGARVVGVDVSDALMAQARALDAADGLAFSTCSREPRRPACPRRRSTWSPRGVLALVRRPAAAQEARRLLLPGGKLCIAHFDWLAPRGSVVEATERLIEAHNPGQPKPHLVHAAGQGVYAPWLSDLSEAGFEAIETFSFDVDVPYSHEAWRGRIRASQGVGATLDPAAVARFDAEHAALLASGFATPTS